MAGAGLGHVPWVQAVACRGGDCWEGPLAVGRRGEGVARVWRGCRREGVQRSRCCCQVTAWHLLVLSRCMAFAGAKSLHGICWC